MTIIKRNRFLVAVTLATMLIAAQRVPFITEIHAVTALLLFLGLNKSIQNQRDFTLSSAERRR